ncbi:MAG TPA: AAA family ATPase [Rhodocyclaceae bacterium]|jgi:ATP-dependent Lon protease|nr:AAA family ATPase [Rhodocyclaceae bacterium]
MQAGDTRVSDVHIPIADMRDIYSMAAVERALEEGPSSRNEALAACYEKMKRLGSSRFVIKPSSTEALDPLYDSCPNFAEVVDDLRKSLALAISGNEPVQFTPILLLGEPGIGKTHFAKHLSAMLGTGFEFVSMSSLTAGWILSGASSQWNNAKAGKVANALIDGDYANPLMVLDEVDKAGGDSRYDPMGALYSLLEHDTARAFRDEFVDIDMDASNLLWIATANDASSLPEPILNRMNVYEVPRPDSAQAAAIAERLYAEILGEHDWGFAPEPSEAVLEKLADLPPRDMRKQLLSALGNAKLAGRDELKPEDFAGERRTKARSIGF